MPSLPKPARGKRSKLQTWLAGRSPALIGETELEEIRAFLGPVSSGYLRRLLRESGVALAPVVEGVRQEDFAALERTLVALAGEYEKGDAARRRELRKLVIEAKDHATFAGRKAEKRAEKDEMKLWMLTWLGNPPVFAQWVTLRRRDMV